MSTDVSMTYFIRSARLADRVERHVLNAKDFPVFFAHLIDRGRGGSPFGHGRIDALGEPFARLLHLCSEIWVHARSLFGGIHGLSSSDILSAVSRFWKNDAASGETVGVPF